MRKYLLTLSLIVTSIGFSFGQSIELRLHGTAPLINGTTITVNGFDSDFDVAVEIDAKNVSSATKTYKVRKQEMFFGTNGQKNAICWGVCTIPVFYGTQPSLETDALAVEKDSTLLYSGHVYPQNLTGQSKLRYVWFDVNNPSDSTYVDVLFDVVTFTSINEKESDIALTVFPNPSTNGVLKVKMETLSTNNKSIVIKDLLGKVVYNQEVLASNNNLTINTSDFKEGIYFVSVYSNNKAVKTEKIVISH